MKTDQSIAKGDKQGERANIPISSIAATTTDNLIYIYVIERDIKKSERSEETEI